MKRRRKAILALAIALTILTALAVLGLAGAVREMRHEGLTYSQWYEGAIYGYYTVLLVLIGLAGAGAICWGLFLRQGRPRRADTRAGAMLKGIACALFALAACGFSWRVLASHRAIIRAAAMNVESLAPYIRNYGDSRVAALACLEVAMMFGIAWLAGRKYK